MNRTKPIVGVIGTTGVGKSKLGIELSKLLNGEVINSDAMQMYKGFPIITNKVTKEECDGVKHHLLDFINISEEYNVKDFVPLALEKINELHSSDKLPIVVGGTHYYVQSLIWDTRQIPIETKLEAEKVENHPILSKVENMTNEELHSALETVDPEMASHWHPNDRRKIIRSLEVFYTTNKKQSDWFLEQQKGHDLEEITRFPTLLFWLFSDKKDLDKRLDDRVDEMVKLGLFNELDELKSEINNMPGDSSEFEKGIKQSIGFKAFEQYLNLKSELSSKNNDKSTKDNEKELKLAREEGLKTMKTQTRRYAKRQVKWIEHQILPLHFKLQLKENTNDHNKVNIFLLDATDLSKWKENVFDKALEITKKFLNNETLPDPVTLNVSASKFFKIKDTTKSGPTFVGWKKRTCEECSRRIDKDTGKLVAPVVLNGDQEWEAHIKSRSHRKQVGYNRKWSLQVIDVDGGDKKRANVEDNDDK